MASEVQNFAEFVSELAEEVERLRAEVEALKANRHEWLRGSEEIGRYLGIKGSSVRRRKRTDPSLPVHHEGRDLVASKVQLDEYMRRRNGVA